MSGRSEAGAEPDRGMNPPGDESPRSAAGRAINPPRDANSRSAASRAINPPRDENSRSGASRGINPPPDENPQSAPRGGMNPRFREGVRKGAPFGIAAALVGTSFGVLARDVGMSAWAGVLMSAIVFAGSAQIAALGILGAGGGLGSAIGAAALMNSRFLPMGIVIGPSLPGSAIARALQGQTVVDASWALASDGKGGFDRHILFGSSAVQYVAWVVGTVVGVLGGSAIGDLETLGLDAVYPAFFLALLIAELRSAQASRVAAAGALIALVLVPFAPPGVPVLAASLATLIGLVGREVEPA